MEEGKNFSTQYVTASNAPKQSPIGYKVTFRCQGCAKETALTFRPGQFSRDYVESFAELLTGRSRFFVAPIANDDPGPLGRCSYCGQRPLDFTIDELFDDDDVEAGRVAFDAYTSAVGGKTHDNKPIPGWEALTPTVRKGWIVAAWVTRLRFKVFTSVELRRGQPPIITTKIDDVDDL